MNLKQIDQALVRIEKQLEKVRGREYELGWQTMRRARVSRKWDKLAEEKMRLLALRDDIEFNATQP